MFLSMETEADREKERREKNMWGGGEQVVLGDHSAVASALKAWLSPH